MNVMDVHALTRGLGRGYVLGDPGRFEAALVEADSLPAEPHGFAADPHSLCDLLCQVGGWDCVLIDADMVDDVDCLVRNQGCTTTRRYESVHLTLVSECLTSPPADDVRILGVDDSVAVSTSPKELQPNGFAALEESLATGLVAGAVQAGRVVTIAYVEALTGRHGAITIHTDEAYRGLGLATAAASLVAQELQRRRLTPVWYTGWDNYGSIRIAEKLGFVVVDRPVYVIRES